MRIGQDSDVPKTAVLRCQRCKLKVHYMPTGTARDMLRRVAFRASQWARADLEEAGAVLPPFIQNLSLEEQDQLAELELRTNGYCSQEGMRYGA